MHTNFYLYRFTNQSIITNYNNSYSHLPIHLRHMLTADVAFMTWRGLFRHIRIPGSSVGTFCRVYTRIFFGGCHCSYSVKMIVSTSGRLNWRVTTRLGRSFTVMVCTTLCMPMICICVTICLCGIATLSPYLPFVTS